MKKYLAKNQFDADKTDFFLLTDVYKIFFEKNEKYFGWKLLNERFNVIFCCSSIAEKIESPVTVNASNYQASKENRLK